MTRDEIMRETKAEGGMFIVIPSVVALDAELPLSAQMLYGIITWKCNNYAYTWATNRELGEALGVSPKRVSALLSLLEERGHIETEVEYRDGTKEVLHRYTYPIMKSARSMGKGGPHPKNKDTPSPENRDTLPSETGIPLPENAEVICNIKNKRKNSTPYSPPKGDGAASDPAPEDKPASKPRRTRQKKSVPTHAPERFEQFWAYYPEPSGSRLKAVEEWDALAPSDELIDEMARALRRQKASRQWQEGVGIPHACRWIRDRRWTDKLSEAVQPQSSGGWAPDPEVTS